MFGGMIRKMRQTTKILNNKKAQIGMPGQNNGITNWLEDRGPLFLIIVATIIIATVLFSIQYFTCQPGFPGTCLKVLCFWGKGLC